MIAGHRVTALVPARAGSKGIPDKNLQPLGGRSLLRWAVEFAASVEEIDRCIVSTDGEQIADEARAAGAEVHQRSADLSSDSAPVIDTIRAVIDSERAGAHPPDIMLLLEPTSPFRTADDVRSCLQGLLDGADSAVTITEADLHPQRALRVEDGQLRPFLDDANPWRPRQELTPAAYRATGAVYAFWAERLPREGIAVLFGRVHPATMPPARSFDIDDTFDLELADALLRQGAIPDVGRPPTA